MALTRIVFFNRFYAPDHSATAQLLSDVAEHLAAAGREVIVVTSRAVYDSDDRLLSPRERRAGVTIVRTWTPGHRAGMAGRLIAYLAYYATASFHALRLADRGTVLVAKTDPPLLSLVVGLGAWRGARLVHWVQDLFPEAAQASGMGIGGGASGTLLRFLRNRSFRRARCVVAIGDLMAARIAATGLSTERIRVIPNWTDDVGISPNARHSPILRGAWAIAPDAFVLEYSGNLGRAHEYETVLGAAERLRDRTDIVFLFIGGGYRARQLAARVATRGLTSFRFMPYQPRERLADSIAVGDAHWVSLRPEFEGLIVPSKVFGICAAGLPLIAICARDGEVARMLPPDEASISIVPGDADALVAAITRLAADRAHGAALGAAARAVLDRGFRRDQGLRRWQALLDEVGADGAPPSR